MTFLFQCAEDEFEITPQHYSLYLDPEERDKEMKISWVSENEYLGCGLPLYHYILILTIYFISNRIPMYGQKKNA